MEKLLVIAACLSSFSLGVGLTAIVYQFTLLSKKRDKRHNKSRKPD